MRWYSSYKLLGLDWSLARNQSTQNSGHPRPTNPYGVYAVASNTGGVSVGTDHDTASFAVATIRRWWFAMGQATYPAAKALMIMADSGATAHACDCGSWNCNDLPISLR